MQKVVAIYGSARKKGFSSLAVDRMVAQLESDSQVETFRLSEMNLKGCRGCFACRLREGCVQHDDLSRLLKSVIEADLVIFSTPVYCFSPSGAFVTMFERLYPLISGNERAAGKKQEFSLKKPYAPRRGRKKSMLVLSCGALGIAASQVRRRIEKNLRINGFDNLGTVVVDGTYGKKKRELTDRQLVHIDRICVKAH